MGHFATKTESHRLVRVPGPRLVLRISADTPDEVSICVAGGSKHQHQLGRNVRCVGLDEGNFRLEKNPQDYAFAFFHDLRARIISRYRKLGGFIPGLSIVASSVAGESCFTEQLVRQIEKDGDPNGQLVSRHALYRVKPGLHLGSWWFKVVYGLPNVEPAILRGCYSASGQEIGIPIDCPAEIVGPHEPVPATAQTELVPGIYYDEFAHSPRRHLEQISGISLGGSNRLFPTLADIEKCLELSTKEGVPVPTTASIISVSDENSRQIWEDLDYQAFVSRTSYNAYEPLRHPNRLRYVHLDLAITGLAGVGICHLADHSAIVSTSDLGKIASVRLRLITTTRQS